MRFIGVPGRNSLWRWLFCPPSAASPNCLPPPLLWVLVILFLVLPHFDAELLEVVHPVDGVYPGVEAVVVGKYVTDLREANLKDSRSFLKSRNRASSFPNSS